MLSTKPLNTMFIRNATYLIDKLIASYETKLRNRGQPQIECII